MTCKTDALLFYENVLNMSSSELETGCTHKAHVSLILINQLLKSGRGNSEIYLVLGKRKYRNDKKAVKQHPFFISPYCQGVTLCKK